MIIKVIEPDRNHKDNYRKLAEYVALGVNNDGQEKVADAWIKNCHNGDSADDFDLCIKEINATRDKNKRANHRSQHIVVSFAKNEYPDKSVLQDIEQNIVKTLGYENHQYMVGVHDDKEHYHMHLAINQIDPKTFNKTIPAYSYIKLDKLRKELEKKHGLYQIPDKDKTNDKNRDRVHTQSQDFKSHTWREPFTDYCKNLKPSINKDMKKANNWQDVHSVFAEHNLQLKKRGNGLVITQLETSKEYNKHVHIKASDFGREYSLKKLEKSYGAYQPAQDDLKANKDKQFKAEPYTAKPLTPYKKHQKQHKQLWNQFLQKKSPVRSAPTGLFANWKQYLFMMSQVAGDPHAMAIIAAMKAMLDELSLQPSSQQKPPKPNLQMPEKENRLDNNQTDNSKQQKKKKDKDKDLDI